MADPDDESWKECDGFYAVKANDRDYPEQMDDPAMINAFEPELVDGCIVDFIAMNLVEQKGMEKGQGTTLLEVDEVKYRRIGFFSS